MRQRNDTPDQLFVQAADPPFVVEVGETIDYESPIIGMTLLPDEPAVSDPKTAKKVAKAAASGEEPAE